LRKVNLAIPGTPQSTEQFVTTAQMSQLPFFAVQSPVQRSASRRVSHYLSVTTVIGSPILASGLSRLFPVVILNLDKLEFLETGVLKFLFFLFANR